MACINSFMSDSLPVHIMNISSMNLIHMAILVGARAISFGSISPMNIFAYAGAILVPIAL